MATGVEYTASSAEGNSSVASPAPRAFTDRISKKYAVPFESAVPSASVSTECRRPIEWWIVPVNSGIGVQVDGYVPPAGLTRYS